ncbi:glycogen debranching enzyme [Anaeromyxobacter oryzae]|uniref:Glycogen debranching enzyme n=1 Tax=Anaeromyxobacter oryzae TaxID=2918170 RepID=A0ABM7WPR6_9BACT|nr:glycogen debranching enzyme [Anaeromyxobacter oryzae]
MRAGGVNFCVFSRHATRVALLLYADATSPEPFQVIELEPERNRTFFFWHVFVEGLPPGTQYTWRVDGPSDTQETGRSFNARKELVDPWARAVTDAVWDRRRAADPDDAGHVGFRAVVTGPLHPRERAAPSGLAGAVVYELHVGGFTRHPSSGVAHPGTFAGLTEKIPYLRELGVTHVELMPVMAFDEQDVPAAVRARGLRNYWGYSTHSFHSPHPRYCVDPAAADREFRALTDALHAAGIRVLLDVVFNHTAEGGRDGPTINFRGLENEVFYHLDPADRRRYRDYTGCGNTVNSNHPIVTAFIVQCLEHWVQEMGADGFRFDLASVFARDTRGEVMSDPPVPWALETSRVLARVPLIAEAWDAAGLYHVGSFPGMAWAEWNGRYRDAVRRFVRGDPGMAGEVATRLAGSADLYAPDGRLPCNSVNFVTCHDGFTLSDLVSYDAKHNEPNGEGGRDGVDDDASWNCGVEGPTSDPAVTALRLRQARNHLAILLLSRGVPMLLAGDEVLRTQRGNNNAWCQDNELSWLDWRATDGQRDMLRFTREVIALRRRHACIQANRFFDGRPVTGRALPDVSWHGARLGVPPWQGGEDRVLALTMAGRAADEEDLHVVLNMSDRPADAALPAIPGRQWHVAIDTSRAPPEDVVPRERQRPHSGPSCRVAARTVVALEARAMSGREDGVARSP